ncbi:hypothetical protein [Floricoccus penangensis]|uniref:hypothetical protein n=1 Tax=Floricoccus penangensis TaxID=1859475 RepID=UPI0020402CC0|nr:hypothetical protein [Floricoccus penangensis]URZ87663.1 hypothetical protein KIW23_01020 [Floricoccus penangensis]
MNKNTKTVIALLGGITLLLFVFLIILLSRSKEWIFLLLIPAYSSLFTILYGFFKENTVKSRIKQKEAYNKIGIGKLFPDLNEHIKEGTSILIYNQNTSLLKIISIYQIIFIIVSLLFI